MQNNKVEYEKVELVSDKVNGVSEKVKKRNKWNYVCYGLPFVVILIVVLLFMERMNESKSKSVLLNTKRNVYWDASSISKEERYRALEQKGITIWFSGLSGSGKSTIGKEMEKYLIKERKAVYRLDGDNVRIGLNRDLGFSEMDRKESVRRVGEMASLFSDAGMITLVGLVSPYRLDRDEVRSIHDKMNVSFMEVFVDVPLEIVKKRDTKGLYEKALRGEIKDFTGISAPYEPPLTPEIHVNTNDMSLQQEVDLIVKYLRDRGHLNGITPLPDTFPQLNLPDGGNCVLPWNENYERYKNDSIEKDAPLVLLREEDVHWVQVIGEGWAAPLKGFMKEGEYLQSLHFNSMLLDTDGLINETKSANTNFSDYTSKQNTKQRVSMPLPIVLPITTAMKNQMNQQKNVVLVAPSGNKIAILKDIEIYPHRKEERITRTFGAMDDKHPYIAEILKSGDYLMGGEIQLLDRIVYNDGLDKFRKTPAELQQLFMEKNADVVFAFQTRNPTHAGHAYLMKAARQELIQRGYKNPVLWLSPLGGWTKQDDVPLDVRVKQHEAILKDNMLDPEHTVLSIWPSPMIYAGPREVLWHAKSRKNAGASFFVVGRDPAGIKRSDGDKDDIYAPDHGRYLLHLAPGLEHDMNIISFTKVYYDTVDHQMKPMDISRKQDFLSISGSRMRSMAAQGLTACTGSISKTWESHPDCVPQGFMAPSGWDIVVQYYQNVQKSDWIPYSTMFVSPNIEPSITNGTFGQLDYRYYFTNQQEDNQIISPWHDIPLQPNDSKSDLFHFIVEIPRGTMAKMEMNKSIYKNPITQDHTTRGTSKSPRYYLYGVPSFNYGFIPQTWEDPNLLNSKGNGGDNDPIDVIEIGSITKSMGSIHAIRILGSLELIDENEVDHKIIAIAENDPLFKEYKTIDDVDASILKSLVDWLKNYKIPQGKSQNHLTTDTAISKDKAIKVIQDTHLSWIQLVNGTLAHDTDFELP